MFQKGDKVRLIPWDKTKELSKKMQQIWRNVFNKFREYGPYVVVKTNEDIKTITVRYWWGFIPRTLEITVKVFEKL